MSNRTDFDALARELAEQHGLSPGARDRIEAELHNAYVAGEEGNGCECSSCVRSLKVVLEVDRRNFDHLVDTARRIFKPISGFERDNDARELAELFLVLAERSKS